MRFLLGPTFVLALLVCATGAGAQDYDSPEVARAKSTIERLKSLVDAGALPRAQLDQADAALADAEDAAFLRTTLYGSNLTEDQCDQMMAAANRRFERRKQAVDKAK